MYVFFLYLETILWAGALVCVCVCAHSHIVRMKWHNENATMNKSKSHSHKSVSHRNVYIPRGTNGQKYFTFTGRTKLPCHFTNCANTQYFYHLWLWCPKCAMHVSMCCVRSLYVIMSYRSNGGRWIYFIKKANKIVKKRVIENSTEKIQSYEKDKIYLYVYAFLHDFAQLIIKIRTIANKHITWSTKVFEKLFDFPMINPQLNGLE